MLIASDKVTPDHLGPINEPHPLRIFRFDIDTLDLAAWGVLAHLFQHLQYLFLRYRLNLGDYRDLEDPRVPEYMRQARSGKKSPSDPVIHVESDEMVGQLRIENRVFGNHPLAVKDVPFWEMPVPIKDLMQSLGMSINPSI